MKDRSARLSDQSASRTAQASAYPSQVRDSLILVVAVIAVFFPVCGHEFVSWDDFQFLVNNPHLSQPTPATLVEIWKEPDPGLYIPLVYTLWWLLALIGRAPDANGVLTLNPWIFHSANLLMHLAAVLLCYRLLRTLLATSQEHSPKTLAALFGGMIFAVHPIQVESVAWAMGMRDLLGGALSILALLLAVRRRNTPASIIMLLAVLSKPSAIVVLPMTIAIDWLWFGERLIPAIRRAWGMVVVALIGAALTLWFQPQIHPNISIPWQRPLIALDAIAFYLHKLVAPIGLTFDYSRRPSAIVANGQIWWTWIVPAVLLLMLAIARSRRWWLAMAMFLLPILPVLGLMPFAFQSISTVADHYLYLSLLGAALGVMCVAQRLDSANLRAALVVICLTLGVLSHVQTYVWHDNASLFTHATQVNPRSAPAWNGLAGAALSRGDIGAADEFTRRGVEANPDYAFVRLTRVLVKIVQRDKPAADEEWAKFVETYKLQSNFDPALADEVKNKLDQMQRD